MNNLCGACGQGYTTLEYDIMDYEYKGIVYQIKSYFRLCDFCGSELAGKDEIALDIKQINDIKSKVDSSSQCKQ